MDAEVYREMMINNLKADESFSTVEIPVDLLPGETEDEAAERWLYAQGILSNDENGMVRIDREKADAFDPNLFKVLNAVFEPELLSTLDSLVESGMIWQSVNDEGEAVYGLTQDGLDFVKNEMGQL